MTPHPRISPSFPRAVRRILSIFAAALVVTASPALAQEVYSNCGRSPTQLTVGALANAIAPVLWLSPDEPLLGSTRNLKAAVLPAPLPRRGGHANSMDRKTVYYRLNQVRLRELSNTSKPRPDYRFLPGAEKWLLDLEHIYSLEFRFLFYYPFDVGFGQHPHDLEVVELQLTVHQKNSQWPHSAAGHSAAGTDVCQKVAFSRIHGAAHGSDWYTNTLEVEETAVDDVVLPIHVLVEEGKHASAPDRNADGWFTPGYDSTLNTNDAWGIRDTLRNNRLGSRGYRSENAKDRSARKLVIVHRKMTGIMRAGAADRASKLKGCLAYSESSLVVTPPTQCDEYDLVEGAAPKDHSWEYCRKETDVVQLPPVHKGLRSFLKKWDFCGRTTVKGPEGLGSWLAAHVFSGPEGPGKNTRFDRLTYGYTWRGVNGESSGGHGVTVAGGFGARVPFIGGWLVPRYTILKSDGKATHALDALYAPSASRIVDWYLAFGVDDLLGSNGAMTKETGVKMTEEAGVKLRFPSLGFPLNSMMSFRLGYRGPLHRSVSSGRWVFEAGFGGW